MSTTLLAITEDTEPRPPCRCGCRSPSGPRWHQRKGPLPILRARHGLGPWQQPDWIDHSWVERVMGSWLYITEPYHLDDDALADLAHLTEVGFVVEITAWRARHYPGHTLAVVIRAAP